MFRYFFVLHTCLYIVFVIVVQDNVSRIKLGSLKSCSYSRLAIVEYKFSLTSRCTRYVLVNMNTVPRVCVHFVLSDWQRGDEIVHQGAQTTNNISFDHRVGRNRKPKLNGLKYEFTIYRNFKVFNWYSEIIIWVEI